MTDPAVPVAVENGDTRFWTKRRAQSGTADGAGLHHVERKHRMDPVDRFELPVIERERVRFDERDFEMPTDRALVHGLALASDVQGSPVSIERNDGCSERREQQGLRSIPASQIKDPSPAVRSL